MPKVARPDRRFGAVVSLRTCSHHQRANFGIFTGRRHIWPLADLANRVNCACPDKTIILAAYTSKRQRKPGNMVLQDLTTLAILKSSVGATPKEKIK
jgi:hypothetical protein